MNSLETKVAVLEHDVKQIQSVFTRLDLAIERMTDVSNCINKMLAVHDTKLEGQESINQDLYDSLEQHRKDTTEGNKELHSRITTVQRELSSDIEKTKTELMGAIKELKVSVDKEEEKNKKRIDKLEKSKYILMGAAMLAGIMLTKVAPLVFNLLKL